MSLISFVLPANMVRLIKKLTKEMLDQSLKIARFQAPVFVLINLRLLTLESCQPHEDYPLQGIASIVTFGWTTIPRCFPHFPGIQRSLQNGKAKNEFQAFPSRFNVKIKLVWADSGIYTSKNFQPSCDADQQDLTFCTVGGHWQNGVAEQ
jgi:hypothetical protein